MTKPNTDAKLIAEAFFNAIAEACGRIIDMDGGRPQISVKPTEYVLDGRTINVKTSSGDFPFWIGLNGHRLFFIVYIADIAPPLARDTYKFTFGGAQKIGWDINCEELSGGVSIWCTADTGVDKTLAKVEPRAAGPASAELTKEGAFWATDVAMMVQSWVRTSERANLTRHATDPAPL